MMAAVRGKSTVFIPHRGFLLIEISLPQHFSFPLPAPQAARVVGGEAYGVMFSIERKPRRGNRLITKTADSYYQG